MEIVILPCGYAYSMPGMSDWYEIHKSCPTCKADINISHTEIECQKSRSRNNCTERLGCKISMNNVYYNLKNILLASCQNSFKDFHKKSSIEIVEIFLLFSYQSLRNC